MLPYIDTTGTKSIYYVYSGEQLRYALLACQDTTGSDGQIEIMADIDLNGNNGALWVGVDLGAHNVSIEGHNHTVYNLASVGKVEQGNNAAASLIQRCTGEFSFQHLTFTNAYIGITYQNADGGYIWGASIVNYVSSSKVKIEDIHVEDSLMVGNRYVGGIVGRFDGTVGSSADDKHMKRCSIKNSISFGSSHVGSLTGPCVSVNEISNCFSVGCKVISTAGHSGGLFSCGGTIADVHDCFVDAEVYGTKDTGVYTGALNGTSKVKSCFSSGFIERNENLGGFVGAIENGATNLTIEDSYSTALVGMRSAGNKLGGFVGFCYGSTGAVVYLKNCFAAGEVGSTDTNPNPSAQDTSVTGQVSRADTDYQGGMIGSARIVYPNETFVNCYYDKQTTAMREWAVGNANTYFSGLTGVLTTDTTKSGTGLTSTTPSATAIGFKGFGTDLWNYDAQEHYPELKIFKNATKEAWGENADLVKAYSLSSTATLMLDTWKQGFNTATGKIDKDMTGVDEWDKVYGTVRDLTSGFNLTSSDVKGWLQTGTENGVSSNPAKTTIHDKEYTVLSLKYQNERYFVDDLVPGIEWMRVETKVGDAKAYRRVRAIPTASINAGQNAVIMDKYDHADDVQLFYSTAKRMATALGDVTTGMFPDLEGKSNGITKIQKNMMTGRVDTINTLFADSNDTFSDVDAGYMNIGVANNDWGSNAKNAKLYVYVYEVEQIEDGTYKIKEGPQIDLSEASNMAKLNGYASFDNFDKRYVISYAFLLDDGRVIQDAKLVRRAKVPFTMELNLYKNEIADANLYQDGGYLYTGGLDLNQFAVQAVEKAHTDNRYQYKEQGTAAWKIKSSLDGVKSVTVSLTTMQNERYEKTIENPKVGDEIRVPMTLYRIIYRNDGYYTIPESVDRTYTLQYDTAQQIYYLEFNKENEKALFVEKEELFFNDIENNIRVNVVVDYNEENHPKEQPYEPENPSDSTGQSQVSSQVNPAKTGDSTKVMLYLMMSSVAGLCIIIVTRKKDFI